MARTKRIALCMQVSDFYEHGIARGVVRYAKEKGNWQLFGYGWMFPPVRSLKSWKGDGIISRVETPADAKRLSTLSLPVVDVAGAIRNTGFCEVSNDDHETGRLAGEHLVSCGFERFAFCGVKRAGWSVERMQGFLEATGIEQNRLQVFEQSLARWKEPGVQDDLARWLRGLERPCAIMACNDTAGVKLTSACGKLKIAVPGEIAVVGVDNEDVLCELSSPSLSSIPCDCDRIGYEAAGALDRILSGKRAPDEAIRIAPMRPVIRATSDTFDTDDALVASAVRFIREHAALGINVYDVLGAVPVSRRNLEVRFRRELGRTIHNEIVRTRVDRACRLLAETDMSIGAIAKACGFSTQQRLYHVFMSETGMAPSVFRMKRGLRR